MPSQALHGGKINKIRLPIRSVFKLYANGIVVIEMFFQLVH